jgi:hypothetical protein
MEEITNQRIKNPPITNKTSKMHITIPIHCDVPVVSIPPKKGRGRRESGLGDPPPPPPPPPPPLLITLLQLEESVELFSVEFERSRIHA